MLDIIYARPTRAAKFTIPLQNHTNMYISRADLDSRNFGNTYVCRQIYKFCNKFELERLFCMSKFFYTSTILRKKNRYMYSFMTGSLLRSENRQKEVLGSLKHYEICKIPRSSAERQKCKRVHLLWTNCCESFRSELVVVFTPDRCIVMEVVDIQTNDSASRDMMTVQGKFLSHLAGDKEHRCIHSKSFLYTLCEVFHL